MRSVLLALALVVAAASCLAKDPVTSPGTGGASSGGTTSKGGAPGTGGKVGTGGVTSNGGTTSSGGTSGPPPAVDCTDTAASFTNLVTGQYGGGQIPVDGSSGKSYFMQANWWGSPYNNQQEQVTGIGFSMTNPSNVITNVKDTPMGYPSIFIGTYGSKASKFSNLPKQISSLTSVPTIFSTNSDSHGRSNYVADYDVWLTQSGSVVTGSNPGSGGAYLMVWLFKPSDRQPNATNGTPFANGRFVDGVSGTWDVWVGTSNGLPCVSYVSNTVLSELEFDLNKFIQDAVTNKYGSISSSQYLSLIFAGFEVWGGGDGLQVKKFCANVK